MNADTLKRWAEDAREVAEAVRAATHEIGVDIWITADGLASDLDRACLDALLDERPVDALAGLRAREGA